jgi:hypothetical protein
LQATGRQICISALNIIRINRSLYFQKEDKRL